MAKSGCPRRKRTKLTPSYCEIPGCGYSFVVQRHRITPGREGGKYELGNVIALCPNHHQEADREHISRQELYYLVQERIAKNAIEDEYQSYITSGGESAEAGSSST